MKAMIFLISALYSSWGFAMDSKELPAATISEKTLGGTVIMLRMKYALVIDGDQKKEITKELGNKKQKELFKKMIMDTKPDQLRKEFVKAKTPVTKATIARYEETITVQPSQLINQL